MMKKIKGSILFCLFMILGLLAWNSNFTFSAEHLGTSVGTSKSTIEHPGRPISGSFVKKSINQYVKSKSTDGIFMVRDENLNKDWRLKLAKVHDPVRTFEKDGKTIYFTCSDFESLDGKDVLDIDFWMVPKGNKLEVIDTKIHKVNGEPRYGYEGITIKEIK